MQAKNNPITLTIICPVLMGVIVAPHRFETRTLFQTNVPRPPNPASEKVSELTNDAFTVIEKGSLSVNCSKGFDIHAITKTKKEG
jgi:hypothetical protein